jgi:hypothetical protein
VSQPASSSREQVVFEEAPAISGRHVVVTVGVPTAPGTSNDSAAPYPADPSVFDGGEVAEGAVAGPLIDPADPFGTAGDRGAETGEVGAGTDQESC